MIFKSKSVNPGDDFFATINAKRINEIQDAIQYLLAQRNVKTKRHTEDLELRNPWVVYEFQTNKKNTGKEILEDPDILDDDTDENVAIKYGIELTHHPESPKNLLLPEDEDGDYPLHNMNARGSQFVKYNTGGYLEFVMPGQYLVEIETESVVLPHESVGETRVLKWPVIGTGGSDGDGIVDSALLLETWSGGGGGSSYDVPWLFTLTSYKIDDPASTTDPPEQIDIPAIKLTKNSIILDFAGEAGVVTFYPGGPSVDYTIDKAGNYLIPYEQTAGNYYLALTFEYNPDHPMKLADFTDEAMPLYTYDTNGDLISDGTQPYQAKLEIFPVDSVPEPVIEGEDENAYIKQHTLLMGSLEIDVEIDEDGNESLNASVSSFRPGYPLSMWPAGILGLPASHPVQ